MIIYVVTDRRLRPDLSSEAIIDAAVRSGADMIQIREKDLPASVLLDLVRGAIAARGADVYVNGRPDIALAAGATGVQLPADAAPVADVVSAWGGRLRVGASVHGLEDARAAGSAGADFVVLGSVFDTPSKRAYGPPLGLDVVEAAATELKIPVIAIGGITPRNISAVARRGAAGVAAVSAILSSENMEEAVMSLRRCAER